MGRSASRQRKRAKWFDYGQRALDQLGLTAKISARFQDLGYRFADESGKEIDHQDKWYVCPECMAAFPRLGVEVKPPLLTLEHVPPKKAGGSELALTCHRCNPSAGTRIDSKLHRGEQVHRVFRGEASEPLVSEIHIEEWSTNCQIQSVDGAILVNLMTPESSPEYPEVVSHIQAALAGQAELRLVFSGLDLEAERSSLLRSGYLIAFAAFGYRYIFRPDLRLVRQQIRSPHDQILGNFAVHNGSWAQENRTLLITDGVDFPRSIVVQMGRRAAILPHHQEGPGFYQRLAEHQLRNRDFNVKGDVFLCPTEPSFYLDGGLTVGLSRP